MKQKIYFRLQAYDLGSLDLFEKNLKEILIEEKIDFSSINLPLKKKKITLLRSPHVNKKAKDQFEIRFYNKLIVLKKQFFHRSFLKKIKTFTRFESGTSLKLTFKNKCKN
jgi:small subunit ribosomal protein S10